MKVYKFGGTSVGTPERMHQVAELVQRDEETKIVVLSAVSGTTNALVEVGEYFKDGEIGKSQNRLRTLRTTYGPFIENLFRTLPGRKEGEVIVRNHFEEIERLIVQPFYDQILKILVVQGELISTQLFQAYMQETSPNRSRLLGATDFMYLNHENEPDIPMITTKLADQLERHPGFSVYITQGFICRNSSGGIDNLKRGGSDYSATLIGAAMKADETQIWTDIDGMHNNDPRIVEHTRPISDLSFDEAGELAYFGAKILHPNCIIPAQQSGVPVRIKNTMNPDAYGTFITSRQNPESVKAIAAKDGLTVIKVKSSRMILAYGFLRKIFEVFETYKTSVDMVCTSEIAVSLSIDDPTHLDKIVAGIRHLGHVEVDQHQTIVCIVGDLVAENKGISGKVFKALEEVPIRMISYGGSRNNISLVIDTQYKKETLTCLNKSLFGL